MSGVRSRSGGEVKGRRLSDLAIDITTPKIDLSCSALHPPSTASGVGYHEQGGGAKEKGVGMTFLGRRRWCISLTRCNYTMKSSHSNP